MNTAKTLHFIKYFIKVENVFRHDSFLLPRKLKMSTDANKSSADSHPAGNGTSAPPPTASDAPAASDDTTAQGDDVADDPAFKDFFSLAGKIVEQDPTQLEAMKNTAKLISSSAKIAMEGLLSKAGLDPADIADKKGINKNSLENYLAVHALVQEKNERKKSGTSQQQQAASTAKRPKQTGPALGAPEQAKKSTPSNQTDDQPESAVQRMRRELYDAYLSGKM